MSQTELEILGSLRVAGLKLTLPAFVLEADFEVRAGERVAIQGASGSGKSSLLRWIAGLSRAPLRAAGQLLVGAREVTRLSPEKREVGFVFQDPLLFPHLSVRENVEFGLRVRGVPAPSRQLRADVWLERVGLLHRAEDSVIPLSGGEKTRVALARALCFGPRVLLLDEAFSNLDAELRRDLRVKLIESQEELKVPLLFVTHDREDVEALATRVLQVQGSGCVRRLVETTSARA